MIRRATLDDAAAIAHVHVTAWQSSYRTIVPDAILDNLALLQYQHRWQQMLAGDAFVLVAEQAGAVVGFAQADAAREPIIQPYTSELNTIYLLPTVQAQGIGRALFEATTAHLAAKHQGMIVWVLKENTAARGFYEHLGGVYLSEAPTNMGDPPLLKVAYGYTF